MDLEALKKQRDEIAKAIEADEVIIMKTRATQSFKKKHLKLVEQEIDEMKHANTEQEKE